jgi:hypothetical protein
LGFENGGTVGSACAVQVHVYVELLDEIDHHLTIGPGRGRIGRGRVHIGQDDLVCHVIRIVG